MENKLTPEVLEKAKLAKSPEEILALAKENGAELTEESAKAYFAKLHKSGEVSDDELDSVSGGGKCGTTYKNRHPVVTAFNSCEYFVDEKTFQTGDGYCKDCTYSGTDKDGLLLCNNPKRDDN